MDVRPDLLLGIIVTHNAAKQQPAAQVPPVSVKATVKTYADRQQHGAAEFAVSTTSVIRETETIASPANQANW